MSNTIQSLLRLLIAVLPFVLLCFADMKANLDKSIRDRQFLMPVVALIYDVIAIILANKVCEWLLKLIRNIPVWLSKIHPTVGAIAEKLLGSINWTYGIFILANFVLLAVYLIVKKSAGRIFRKKFGNNSVTSRSAVDSYLSNDSAADFSDNQLSLLHIKIASRFYDYDRETNLWFTKNSLGIARKYCQTFFVTAIFISTAIFVLCRSFMEKGLIAKPFYPVFGIILMGEILFYIQGYTKAEYRNEVLGEEENAEKVANYSILRKVLRNLFGDHLGAENTTVNNSLESIRTNNDVIENFLMSEDSKTEAFGKFLKALSETGTELDQNYIFAAKDLLDGKSVVFNNPFYNDMVPYVFYPLNRALLCHRKVLVVLGRHAIEKDIEQWIAEGITAITKIPTLWNVGVLNGEEQDLDIGIITRSDVHDLKLHEANRKFFEDVAFILILEPSRLLTTAQIGLNSIVRKCRTPKKDNLVFCSVDKNCDGLVDSLSHVLMVSLSEVSATNKHLGVNSYMCWDTDQEYLHHRMLPNISRYLGMGTELSFLALKNQVSCVSWYGGEAYPVKDQQWIDRQYYYDLLRYAGLPATQDSMDYYFKTSANFWSAKTANEMYMTVEDESFNMFEIVRNFSTRATEQGFVNVISSEYLLKDYMADNASIFEADPKAIPYIVADYARTARNVTLRILLMMATGFLCEEYIRKELSLIGYAAGDVKKQLWYEIMKCYSSSAFASEPDQAYFEKIDLYLADGSVYTVDCDLIQVTEQFNMDNGLVEKVYYIRDTVFIHEKLSELFNAGYISEDEKGNSHYLGSELMGHVFQKYLPGQFFVFDGKYYEMLYLTGDYQVLVRRAADHIFGRPAYRQIRSYTLHNPVCSEKMGAQKEISGIKIFNEFADISVVTPAYLRMKTYKDFETAKTVSINGVPDRNYRNKQILRIELPDADDDVVYTIAGLMNEVFRTLFAENQAYICALTAAKPEEADADTPVIEPNTYSIDGDIDAHSIYIIEDSQLDIGLLVAVERNLKRIFEIICDYLVWNDEAIERSKNPPPEPPQYVIVETEMEPPKKKGIFGRIKDWFKRHFCRKKKKDKDGKKKKDKGEKKKKRKKKKGEIPEPTVAPPEAPQEPESTEGPVQEPITVDFSAGDDTPTEAEPQPVDSPDTASSDDEEAPQEENESVSAFSTDSDREEPMQPTDNQEPPVTEDAGTVAPLFSIRPLMRYFPDFVPVPEEISKTEESPEPEAKNERETADAPQPETESLPPENDGNGEPPAGSEELPVDGDTITGEEEVAHKPGIAPPVFSRALYHERYYLLYGAKEARSAFRPSKAKEYLMGLGFGDNSLKQAREGRDIVSLIEKTFDPLRPGAHFCDFCAVELVGTEYEILADGRERCMQCGRTAVKTTEEFAKIFKEVKRNMESFFDIKFNASVRVEMVNTKKLAKIIGDKFEPTNGFDARAIGVAIHDQSGYKLLIENGTPRVAAMLTIAHELTHIWQYLNWDDSQIRQQYGEDVRLEVYEGMAKWVEVQYAILINEIAMATREKILTLHRNDEYGRGFVRYLTRYPLSMGRYITKETPFMNGNTPL